MSEAVADRFMTLGEYDALDDGYTVGVLHDYNHGPETVRFEDVGATLWAKFGYEFVDDGTRLFIASDGGDLSVQCGPHFAPIETNCTIDQAKTALKALNHDGVGWPEFDLLFDHRDPIVFESDDCAAVMTPAWFPWDEESQTAPCGPSGPQIGGATDE